MSAPNFAELIKLEETMLAAQLRAVRAAITHREEKGRGLEHRALVTRRYLVDPDRTVNVRGDYDAQIDEMVSFGGEHPFHTMIRRASLEQILPPPRSVPVRWDPVRCFAIAFDYDCEQVFDENHASARMSEARIDGGRLDAVFVPDTCVLWDEDAAADAEPGAVRSATAETLAAFRHRLLDALSSFPRPSEGATMDLRPYFAPNQPAAP